MTDYSHLTAKELCERINHMRKRMGYSDTRVIYQGRGWYHRYTSGLSWPFKERRSQVEESLRRFEERERREEAERPAREAAERENARRRALVLAAEDMLAVLTSIDGRYQTGDVTMGDDLYAYLRTTIAKAEGREVVS